MRLEFTHQPRKTLEGSRYPNTRVHLNQYTLCRMDIHLQETGLVERRVKKGQEALKCV